MKQGDQERNSQKSPHSAKATRGRKVKTAGRNWRVILNICLVFALLIPVGLDAAQEDEVVRLMVELRKPDSLELRRAVRDIRKISNQAPRSYVTDKGVKWAKDLRRWRVIEVEAENAQALLETLQHHPAVASVHQEVIYEAAFVPFDPAQGKPNDPLFPEQIGLHNETWPLDINAPEAWEKTTGSGSTVIAIVDGGVDLLHEDLKDKVWTNSDEVAGNGVDDDGNGFIDDVRGWDFVADRPAEAAAHHATHVAGIAAASGNNNVGVAGVDWGAKIMSVRVLSSTGFGGEADIIAGINYAVANGADIINLSIVGLSSQALLDAIENAYAAGVVVVAAAGNSGVDTGRANVLPACADVGGVNMVLGVAALGKEGEPAGFSNYGSCVDVSAPGEDILSTKAGDRYGTMKGTSMSSPFVAGVAGLYLSLHPNAGPAEVISAITGNMSPFTGGDAEFGNAQLKGRLNAAAVVGAGTASGAGQGSGNTGGDSSGGGGGDSGGGDSGGGGGGGGSEEPQPTPKPKVAGAAIKISAADRKAPDFIQNHTVPAVVERLFWKVWGRKITHPESLSWKVRARQKPTETKVFGAMMWHKAKGKTYTVTAKK